MRVNMSVKIDTKKLAKQFEALRDDECMYQIHDLFAKMCDPYVPMYQGVLSQNGQAGQYLTITKDGVRWFAKSDPSAKVSYAHYQYVGEVYGPNIPIIENGIITGWFSLKDVKKKPTGRELQYSKEGHSLASKEWDKAMMRDKGEVFIHEVKRIVMDRFKELYG